MHELKARVPGPYGEIPLLMLHRGGAFRGTVLLFHGLRSQSRDNHAELALLAERGFLAVGVDAIAHGERRASDFDEQVGRGFHSWLRWVQETANEVPVLVDALAALLGPRMGKLGLTGISMGGYVAYAAALREPRVAALVPILGSPDWTGGGQHETAFSGASPHHHPEGFAPRPLLALNAGQDQSVPPRHTRAFLERLRPYYAATPEALQYHEYPESGHFMSGEDWRDVWVRTGAWFERWLV